MFHSLNQWVQKHNITLGLVLSTPFLILFVANLLELQNAKYLWTDEAFEIFGTCQQDWKSLVIDGAAGQCSPQPLYYIFQKLSLSWQTIQPSLSLIQFRLVNLFACLGLIGVFVWQSLSMQSWVGFLAVSVLSHQWIWSHYSAENRPYSLWLFFFALLVVVMSRLVDRQCMSLWERLLILGTSLGIATVAAPGMIQFALGAFVVGIQNKNLQIRKWLIGSSVAGIAIGLFYFGGQCGDYQSSSFNLLQTRDLSLVAGVIRLGFPKGEWLNLFFFVGIGALFWSYKNSKIIPTKNLRTLGWICMTQMALTFPLGIAVALKNFHFVQRVFIYNIVCWAGLVAIGLIVTLTRIPLPWKSAAKLLVLIVILITGILDQGNRVTQAIEKSVHSIAPLSKVADCTDLKATIQIWLPKNALDTDKGNAPAILSKAFQSCPRPLPEGMMDLFIFPDKISTGEDKGNFLRLQLPNGQSEFSLN